jgi:uncharacterized protein (DUF1697 family)
VTAFFALLRGINVGGNRPVPMAALREAFEAEGHRGVATYIQSGNVRFQAGPGATPDGLARSLERRLARAFGWEIPVVVRSATAFARIAAGHPLARGADVDRLQVVFLSSRPGAAALARLETLRALPDTFVARGSELYVHCPQGFGKTKLTLTTLERHLGITGTARNWKTVTALAAWVGSDRVGS